ncbi:hypothetical protein, partial [Micromonospora sp. WMMD736]|uniref:hypothetical protein n=1 Tax=Micromonospora sp. WMMD736 TaxID=3404112 RepID=UPI003B9579CF
AVSDQDLIEHCRAHLAAYKLPRRFVDLDTLPKNAAGKIIKRELRELACQLDHAIEHSLE